ncbi:hypothetical protein VTJ83DRAFT_6837 [Remersonia thermophila]|uniref:Uncharacterized protein n=1 Tax=Remersonia thermophila TaxID=72144 RepID=A0ABR4D632_9PEZI
MRFSTAALLALPVLASASESPFQQYKAKFQNFLSNLGASPLAADKGGDDAATTQKEIPTRPVEPKTITTLTLANWKDVLYEPVQPEATHPEQWLVLVSGRNNTCFGKCDRIDGAWNASALAFASLPSASSLHLGYVNCDDERVLCNYWSAATGVLWLLDIPGPAPAPVEIRMRRMNTTTVTTEDIVEAYKEAINPPPVEEEAQEATGEEGQAAKKGAWHRYSPDGYFHPFDGKLAKAGLLLPLAYFFWAINAIPQWGLMLILSFFSRSMMNRRMNNLNPPAGAPGAGAAPRPAQN